MSIIKKTGASLCFFLVALLLIPFVYSSASFSDFSDVEGHWADYIMSWAYDDGLINGVDGCLYPDENITVAQALAILCRVLDVQNAADISGVGLSGEVWYYDFAAKSVSLGLISPSDATKLGGNITHQDAYSLLAEAFQLTVADPDMSVLEQFSDSWMISPENRQALASLASKGFIPDFNGKMNVDNETTRAQFLSVLYRIIKRISPAAGSGGDYDCGVVLRGSAELRGADFEKGVWFDCASGMIAMNGVAADVAVIRSGNLESLTIGESTHIGRLTIASQTGNINVSPQAGAAVDTLTVGSGSGEISVGGIKNIEVTGNNRRVAVSGDVESIVVSGRNSTVSVASGARVGSVMLLINSLDSQVISDGYIGELEIRCIGGKVSGAGNVDTLRVRRPDTLIDVTYGQLVDAVDIGLLNASVRIDAPDSLHAGYTLDATAVIADAAPGMECDLAWYLDGVVVMDERIMVGSTLPKLSKDFEYSRVMPESAVVRIELKYTTALGEEQVISDEKTVNLENYGKRYWMSLDAPAVMGNVTLGYLGNYTLQWTIDNDLDDYDKEVWVNTKGYSSSSEYLLWINLAYQRVNIFRNVDGCWELIRTCIVGTGAPGRGTPVGVWTTSYKQLDGWNTSSYTVKPVVRFMGSVGYAFHSRLYYPYSTTLLDPGIGYPISHGCIRMYDEDIWFIYDNIPDGTTVVVY